jgi:hypothetical protein
MTPDQLALLIGGIVALPFVIWIIWHGIRGTGGGGA